MEKWRKRERARHYHRPRRATQATVDLAEHFNDSSLPRAFTAPAVSRLGYRSVCVCISKQLSNSKRTSRRLSINVRSRSSPRSPPPLPCGPRGTIFVRFLSIYHIFFSHVCRVLRVIFFYTLALLHSRSLPILPG